MWHTIAIGLHAIAGVAAFVAGFLAIRTGRWTRWHTSMTAAMTGFLVLAIATEWTDLTTVTRLLFTALAALAGFMTWRGVRAHQLRPTAGNPVSKAFFDQLGFNLVALFDAFLVITVLNAGAPGWAVAATGVLVAIAGHFVLGAVERRLVPSDRHQATEPSTAQAAAD